MKNIFSLAIFFHILSVIDTSFIQLNNGNYDDIVIAIHPGVQEDDMLIQKIKDMVTDASAYLFHATENRLSIGNVKILIPLTWTSKNHYESCTRETYEKSDVIISNPYLKFDDSPYTLQYRGCGERGEHIHLTPNYLLNTHLSAVYGSPGRIFVHEWAHFRWGVFEETNDKVPYYISGELKVEATRCAASLSGSYMMRECKNNICSLRDCKIDYNTGLYEQGCLFLPEKVQNVQESIMYHSGLQSITSFCNDSSHNIEAPSLQNKMCNCRSTWDIIRNSVDIISTPPRSETNLPVPTFTLIQSRKRVITLAFDISGSMDQSHRLGRLLQGAEYFLTQVAETETYIGIVEFAFFAFVVSNPVRITEENLSELISLLPSTTLNENADICRGILEAIKVNQELNGSAAGTEILVAIDGDSNLAKCSEQISSSGAVIHMIALGSEASKQLERIVDMTGGKKHFAADVPDANDIFIAFNEIASHSGDLTTQSFLLESRNKYLESEGCLNGTIFIDSTVGKSTFIQVTWQVYLPSISLQDPNGNRYNAAQFTNNTNSNSSTLRILGKAETGVWNYTICNNIQTSQVIGLTVTSKAADKNVPPITVNAHMNKEKNKYPDPMIIYASVRQGQMPVTNLHVTAVVESESGKTVSMELLDNGAGADVFKNDGVYSRYFTSFRENGSYSLIVHVKSQYAEARLALPRNRALYIPGYTENGVQSVNPPEPSFNDSDLHILGGYISRIVSGGLFIVYNVPGTPQVFNYKPCKIIDLEANRQEDSIVLSWTAAGGDLDQNQASRYDLRMSTNPRDLRDNYKNSTRVEISNLIPKLFGSMETFTFTPRNNNGTILYFALTVIDQDNKESDISNIAQAGIPSSTPPEPSSIPTDATYNSSSFATDATSFEASRSTITLSNSTDSSDVTSFTPLPTNSTLSIVSNSVSPTTSLKQTNNDTTVTSTLSTSLGTISPTISLKPTNTTDTTVTSTLSTSLGTISPTTSLTPTLNTDTTVTSTLSTFSGTISPTTNIKPTNNTDTTVTSTLSTSSGTISPTISINPTNNTDTTVTSTLSTSLGTISPTTNIKPTNNTDTTVTSTLSTSSGTISPTISINPTNNTDTTVTSTLSTSLGTISPTISLKPTNNTDTTVTSTLSTSLGTISPTTSLTPTLNADTTVTSTLSTFSGTISPTSSIKPTNNTNTTVTSTLSTSLGTISPTFSLKPTNTTDTTVTSTRSSSSGAISPSTSINPSNNTDSTVTSTLSTSSRTISPTTLTQPPNIFNSTPTNSSLTLTTTGIIVEQGGSNINVTAVVVIVCVTAVVLAVIICLIVYFSRYYRTGRYRSTLV